MFVYDYEGVCVCVDLNKSDSLQALGLMVSLQCIVLC